MTNEREPWPDKTQELVTLIIHHRDRIKEMVDTCIFEGCKEGHYAVITVLYPMIRERVIKIRRAARDINRLIPDRRGRPAKWGEISQDVYAVSSDMRDLCNEMPELLRGNRYRIICEVLKDLGRGADKIARTVYQIPAPKSDDVPEVWREAWDD